MVKKRKKEEPSGVGAPLWMLTYGDMITLVLTFFILLYSYSTIDAIKWKQAVSSLKGSLGVMNDGSSLNDLNMVGQGEPGDDINKINVTVEDLADFEKLQQEKREMEDLKASLREQLAEIDQRIIVSTMKEGNSSL